MLRPLSDRLWALIAANFAAAASTGLAAMGLTAIYVLTTPPGLSNGVAPLVGAAVGLGLIAAIAATLASFVCFLAGLTAIGIPTWWLLHRTGWTSRFAFISVAALESVVGGSLIAPQPLTLETLSFIAVISFPGGLAGWIIWRLGYAK
nr:hypothetical protein [uncultured Brevundimonas sp.]